MNLYDYILDNALDTSDVPALLATLQAQTTMDFAPKKVVNNFIVSRSLNIKLRAICNEAAPHAQYDAALPNAGGLTVRLAAQAGLDWLLTDSGETVNPNNATLQNLIALLQAVGVFSVEEVADFWALFAVYRWPNLTLETLQAALNTPQIEAVETLINKATNGYNAALVALQENLNALRAGEDADELTGADVAALMVSEL